MTKVWNNPDVFSIQVELPQNPVRSLNAYVIAAPEQNLLIDTGFNRPKCSAVLWEGILELGHNLKKTSVFLTHLHSDHTGLTGEFVSAGCPIHMGRIDYEHMVGMRTGTNLSGIEALFCQEGCPSDELVLQREQNQGYKYRVKELFPAHLVDDESAISLGPLDVKDATLWPELLIPNKSYIIGGLLLWLIVEAYYTCKPGTRPELLKIVKPNIEGTRKEPDNISYMHYPDPNDETGMFVFEKWESLELFNNHSKTEHHKTFCAARRPLLEPGSYQITIYNAEVNEERTRQSREFVKKAIN